MKTNLSDLNEYLFLALERLNDDSLDKDELAVEIMRSRAVSDVSKQIIDAGKLMLETKIAIYDSDLGITRMPDLLKDKPPALGLINASK